MVKFMVQYHTVANNLISLIVYFEVPEGKREEVQLRLILLLVKTTSFTKILSIY